MFGSIIIHNLNKIIEPSWFTDVACYSINLQLYFPIYPLIFSTLRHSLFAIHYILLQDNQHKESCILLIITNECRYTFHLYFEEILINWDELIEHELSLPMYISSSITIHTIGIVSNYLLFFGKKHMIMV